MNTENLKSKKKERKKEMLQFTKLSLVQSHIRVSSFFVSKKFSKYLRLNL